jgi:hypothetical protein
MAASTDRRQGGGDRLTLAAAAIALLAVVLLVVALVHDGGSSSETGTRVVPEVVGLLAAQARDTVEDAGFAPGFARAPANARRCRVFAQAPRAGGRAEEGRRVVLRCRARVPRVLGHAPATAAREIADAGFHAAFFDEPGDGERSACRVAAQSRSDLAEPQTRIGLRLACPAADALQSASVAASGARTLTGIRPSTSSAPPESSSSAPPSVSR